MIYTAAGLKDTGIFPWGPNKFSSNLEPICQNTENKQIDYIIYIKRDRKKTQLVLTKENKKRKKEKIAKLLFYVHDNLAS